MWQRLLRGRDADWEHLDWFRLRYENGRSATRWLNLLSAGDACGQIWLYYQPGAAVSLVVVGVPIAQVRLLPQMAADLGFMLEDMSASFEVPKDIGRWQSVKQLPWQTRFLAKVEDGQVRMACWDVNGAAPDEWGGGDEAAWQLPMPPPPGLRIQPVWSEVAVPKMLLANGDREGWRLGYDSNGRCLRLSGHLNVYGRSADVAAWMEALVHDTLLEDGANLIVIDGRGDLVPKLKRKTAVTQLMGEKLTYLDLDSATTLHGFNPLAALPDEAAGDVIQRWQAWFTSMGVHRSGVQLLPAAHSDGVDSIPALQKWLRQMEARQQQTAVAALKLALTKLTSERTVYDWLSWPDSHLTKLEAGSLLFACRATTWARQQILYAAYLAATVTSQSRLMLHGFPWSLLTAHQMPIKECIIGNGPPLSGATAVAVRCSGEQAARLVQHFGITDAFVVENLQLLRPLEAAILNEGQAISVWLREEGGGKKLL